MIDIIKETLIDSIKLLPFLFLTYLVMEYIEHKTGEKTKDAIKKAGKFGPLVGSVLGAAPQCGFSVASANLYAARVISFGTLISVFLSTSDEMLPILISSGAPISTILKILGIKIVIGFVAGTVIDLLLRLKNKNAAAETEHIHDMCEHEHCHCEEEGVLKSSIKHTFNIFVYIILISFILNALTTYIGESTLSKIFLSGSFFAPALAGLLGLIPNCASSVILTKLYLAGTLSFGAVISGLLVSSGLGVAVLFKVNKSLKENIYIIAILLSVGIASGIIIDMLKIVV